MNQRKVGAVLSYISFFISNAIGLIYAPFMLRLMGQSEYGLWGVANSLTSYLSLLNFGIGGAYLRFYSRCKAQNDLEGEKRLNGTYFLIFAFLSVLVLLGGGIILMFVDVLVEQSFTLIELQRLQIILLLGTVNMCFTFLISVINMTIQAHEQFVYARISNIVFSVLNPLVNVVVLLFGGRAVALSIVCLVLSLISYLVHIIFALKVINFRMSFKGIKFSYFREIFVFSGFLFINSITDQITSSTDGVILSAIWGTTAVSVYTVGAQFQRYFASFSVAISGVFSPRVNNIVATTDSHDELNELFLRIGRIQFYILSLMLIGYTAIGRDFIKLWAGPDYGDSYMVGLLLILSSFIPLFQNVGLEIQKAKNKHKTRSVVYLLIAITNLGLTIPFAKWWGGIGAALATLICSFAGTGLFMNFYYAKGIGLNIGKFWKSIFSIVPSFLPSIITGVIIFTCFSLDRVWKILAATVILMTTYLLPVWFFSMNQYEKGLFRSPVEKIFRKRSG